MNSKQLCLFLLFNSIIKAEIFTPEEVSENDLTNTENNTTQEDPFVDNLVDQDANIAQSDLVEHENNNNMESNLTDNEVNELENALTATATENAESDNLKEDDSKSSKQPKEQNPKVSKLIASSGKMGEPYWTEVVINKQKKNVLVNVKTVTIIESISGAGVPVASISVSKSSVAPKSASVTRSLSTAVPVSSPYIKIQMPSKYSTVSKSAKSAAASISKSASKAKKPASVTKSVSAKSISSVSKSKTQSITSTASKGDAFAKKSSVSKAPTAVNKTISASSTTPGSIFDILKNLPSGGKENESIFVEGSFKFPKKKDISNKVFKLSGYVSTS